MPIRPDLPPEPHLGDPLAPVHESAETLRLLALRRSTPVAMLGEPGPSPADVDQMLRLAVRVPDHRKLEPWRILVIEGEARAKLGEVFATARKAADPSASDATLANDRALPLRAPVIVAVISAPVHNDPKKTPVWEQELSAGAVCQTLMIAAAASGWAACWISEWPAFDANVHSALGMSSGEKIAGFIYLGTAKDQPVERPRPEPGKIVKRWTGR
jgi:nitroreductase